VRIPVAAEGWPFIFPPAVAACILALMGWHVAAGIVAAVALAFLAFFRDPERAVPTLPGAVLAPADGKVMGVAEVEDRWVGRAVRLSIFLSPLDVHVNRAPAAGIVRDVEYVPGRFLAAYKPEASERNERCTVALESDPARLSVRQISGVLARRIVCRVRPGDRVQRGERFGMIMFGSRVDLFLPVGVVPVVHRGDRVRAGTSVIAEVKS
jgi:phosphatidylserine decarboxylase